MREAGDRTIGAVVLLEEDRNPHEGFAISTTPTWQRRHLSESSLAGGKEELKHTDQTLYEQYRSSISISLIQRCSSTIGQLASTTSQGSFSISGTLSDLALISL
jgi:hypothetical protein